MNDDCLTPIPWETRNLGMPAFALSASFAQAPDEARLRAALQQCRTAHASFFAQARITPDSRLSQMLERHGFYFVETALRVSIALAKPSALDAFRVAPEAVLPRRYATDTLALRPLEARTGHDIDAVLAIAAESFVDDRFHHDHQCPTEVADRRYRLWTADLLADASVHIDLLTLREAPIGFMARRGEHLLLAGFARRYAGAGLGQYLWLRVLDGMDRSGLRRAHSVVSANNIPVLNLYTRLGFRFSAPQPTYHTWEGR